MNKHPIPRTPTAALVTGLLAAGLAVALTSTQPALAATVADSDPVTGPSPRLSAPHNRPTGRFLKQPLRLPPDAYAGGVPRTPAHPEQTS